MSDSLSPTLPRSPAEANLVEVASTGVLAGILVLFFVGVAPLPDLSDKALLELVQASDAVANALYVVVTGLGLACVVSRDPRGLLALLRRPLLAALAWLALSVVVSPDLAASAKRLTLALITLLLAACAPLLATDLKRFAALLFLGAGSAVALSWGGVILAPELAIHQWTDVGETELAGAWRGIYNHKNGAGAMMVVFVFAGLFVGRVWNRAAGTGLAVAAALFLPMAQAKSALALGLGVLLLSMLVPRLSGLKAKAVLVLGPFLVLNALSVGTVILPALRAVAGALPLDTSFTGRADVWEVGLEAIARRPWLGHGFQSFWGSASVVFGSENAYSWAETASTSHNAHVDIALSAGLPGLALCLVAFVAMPLLDFHRRPAGEPANEAFALFGLRVWLFGLYLASFEAFFLNRSDPMWFSFALGLCALRYASAFRLKA